MPAELTWRDFDFWMRPDNLGAALLVLIMGPIFAFAGNRVPRKTYYQIAMISVLGLICLTTESRVASGLFRKDMAVDTNQSVADNGFELTRPLYEIIKRNAPWSDDVCGLINSLVLLITFIHAMIYTAIFKNHMSLAWMWLVVQYSRVACGLFSSLPKPAELRSSDWDFPNMYHSNSIFFFSGHVAFYCMYATWQWRTLARPRVACFFYTLAFLSAVIMLAMRGHYSIDILIGALYGMWLANQVHRLDPYTRADYGANFVADVEHDGHGGGGSSSEKSTRTSSTTTTTVFKSSSVRKAGAGAADAVADLSFPAFPASFASFADAADSSSSGSSSINGGGQGSTSSTTTTTTTRVYSSSSNASSSSFPPPAAGAAAGTASAPRKRSSSNANSHKNEEEGEEPANPPTPRATAARRRSSRK